MGSCVSTTSGRSHRDDDRLQGVLPDEVNRLLDKWAIGHVLVCVVICFVLKSNDRLFVSGSWNADRLSRRSWTF